MHESWIDTRIEERQQARQDRRIDALRKRLAAVYGEICAELEFRIAKASPADLERILDCADDLLPQLRIQMTDQVPTAYRDPREFLTVMSKSWDDARAVGRQEGRIDVVRRLLAVKFGELASEIDARIERASSDDLDRVLDRVPFVDSLASAVADLPTIRVLHASWNVRIPDRQQGRPEVRGDALRRRLAVLFGDIFAEIDARIARSSPEEIDRFIARADCRLPQLRYRLTDRISKPFADPDPDAREFVMAMHEVWHRQRADGRALGRTAALRRLLAVKFGELPPKIDARVASASPSDVDRFLERVLFADSLASIFT
jgi:hypothetical protein